MENRLELGEVAGRLHTGRTCLPQHINRDWICPLAAGCPNCNRMKPSRCLLKSLRASIAELVLPCGCSSVSCFSHLFTAEGTALWQWRNTQDEKNRLQPRAGRHFSDFSTNRPYKVRDAIDKKGRKVLWTSVSMSEL
ncbi:hypothetical protein J4866_06855 [Prevotella denticola]|uniref:hypothetical protein n=1 Tax=Prevotella denticola TaxID=28129 RepID=UPI001BA8375A|nr:hypothetical protein [Prevotella denticola]QUB92662.1 hypothetical protein J4866_06855 [Prevotella denticola]